MDPILIILTILAISGIVSTALLVLYYAVAGWLVLSASGGHVLRSLASTLEQSRSSNK